MATLKTCFKCGEEKPMEEFYRHSQMGDGHLGKCKKCAKIDAWKNRQENIDAIRAYDNTRSKMPHRAELRKLVYKEWKKKFPDRRRAQTKLYKAVLSGAVEKLPCWVCGGLDVEAHHPDYSLPLDVVWLCVKHHRQAHATAKITWDIGSAA